MHTVIASEQDRTIEKMSVREIADRQTDIEFQKMPTKSVVVGG